MSPLWKAQSFHDLTSRATLPTAPGAVHPIAFKRAVGVPSSGFHGCRRRRTLVCSRRIRASQDEETSNDGKKVDSSRKDYLGSILQEPYGIAILGVVAVTKGVEALSAVLSNIIEENEKSGELSGKSGTVAPDRTMWNRFSNKAVGTMNDMKPAAQEMKQSLGQWSKSMIGAVDWAGEEVSDNVDELVGNLSAWSNDVRELIVSSFKEFAESVQKSRRSSSAAGKAQIAAILNQVEAEVQAGRATGDEEELISANGKEDEGMKAAELETKRNEEVPKTEEDKKANFIQSLYLPSLFKKEASETGKGKQEKETDPVTPAAPSGAPAPPVPLGSPTPAPLGSVTPLPAGPTPPLASGVPSRSAGGSPATSDTVPVAIDPPPRSSGGPPRTSGGPLVMPAPPKNVKGKAPEVKSGAESQPEPEPRPVMNPTALKPQPNPSSATQTAGWTSNEGTVKRDVGKPVVPPPTEKSESSTAVSSTPAAGAKLDKVTKETENMADTLQEDIMKEPTLSGSEGFIPFKKAGLPVKSNGSGEDESKEDDSSPATKSSSSPPVVKPTTTTSNPPPSGPESSEPKSRILLSTASGEKTGPGTASFFKTGGSYVKGGSLGGGLSGGVSVLGGEAGSAENELSESSGSSPPRGFFGEKLGTGKRAAEPEVPTFDPNVVEETPALSGDGGDGIDGNDVGDGGGGNGGSGGSGESGNSGNGDSGGSNPLPGGFHLLWAALILAAGAVAFKLYKDKKAGGSPDEMEMFSTAAPST